MSAALDLRTKGKSYREIAAALGISVGAAYNDVRDALAALEAECAEKAAEVRRLEVDRLDKMLSGLWDAAEQGDPRSIEVAIKLMDRRAKLLGLDAPTKSEVSGPDGGAISIDDARALLASKLASLATGSESGAASSGSSKST